MCVVCTVCFSVSIWFCLCVCVPVHVSQSENTVAQHREGVEGFPLKPSWQLQEGRKKKRRAWGRFCGLPRPLPPRTSMAGDVWVYFGHGHVWTEINGACGEAVRRIFWRINVWLSWHGLLRPSPEESVSFQTWWKLRVVMYVLAWVSAWMWVFALSASVCCFFLRRRVRAQGFLLLLWKTDLSVRKLVEGPLSVLVCVWK